MPTFLDSINHEILNKLVVVQFDSVQKYILRSLPTILSVKNRRIFKCSVLVDFYILQLTQLNILVDVI